MTDPEPNAAQQRLIDETEGIYVVDAGAGTGKTFAITRRYAEIVDDPDVDPDDVLLATFTDGAATEMRERIVTRSSYGVRELADAPIQTFHSLCHDILDEHGHRAPVHLGIDDRITGRTRILDDEIVEARRFREFYDRFRDEHPEHADLFRIVDDPSELLDLIEQLAAKGVFPTADGWYRDGEARLDGDRDLFDERFAAVNEPRNGGSKQSELRKRLGRYGREKCYLPGAPSKETIRGDRGTKAVPDSVADRVFEEDRAALKAFVHDVYHGYLEFALSRNYLTFGFLQAFAFVLLCEDDALRESVAFEYVMVDEFQDTSEIQFQLALLLAGTDNLCVVGDWKQSIYSFQYAAVENITEFASRLERFAADLNGDRERIDYDLAPVESIELAENYRSTETILRFADETLVTPAATSDDVDAAAVREEIVELRSNAAVDETRIEAVAHEEGQEAVLTKIQEIVGNDEYAVADEDGAAGARRPPKLGDITVLTRTRDWGREFIDAADASDVPVSYDGGVEVFRTDDAKLLLAWLRILTADADRGWAVVLEAAGYALDEIEHLLDAGGEAYPQPMLEFRDRLAARESVGAVARQVFDRYGCEGSEADVLVDAIQSVHDETTLTTGDLVEYLASGIESGAERDVSTSAGSDSVTVQTIHGAKGREYPIVILANMNDGKFPPSGGGSPTITYDEAAGLRQRKRYAEAHGRPHVYDDWRTDVLRHCRPDGFDEERRLLYVATTRAKEHVVFAAGERPNAFLEELDVRISEYPPDVSESAARSSEQTTLAVSVPTPDGPVGETPHTIMRDEVFENVDDGRGSDFGSDVHDFAEAYALGEDVDPDEWAADTGNAADVADFRNVAALIDSLEGKLLVEEDAYLPLEVDGERVTLSGQIDLVHVRPDRVAVIDYKTDLGRLAEDEYRKQLSVYSHVVAAAYPDREVTTSLFFTADDDRVYREPLSRTEIEELVSDVR